ncbi:hypothetical protein D3OALGA1CA_2644 [Olavius algarvensis associated proteobacterium Delta 3]|nr:hypothetical protein D3OALGA1CA_2644 [Olavius algarvensis associated proteobacterium Delta 3]CAB5131983.1 hypothetical protein D3OALGB2SA_3694 [Olavius algarvensis associated proteobacterium Delta 3]
MQKPVTSSDLTTAWRLRMEAMSGVVKTGVIGNWNGNIRPRWFRSQMWWRYALLNF